MSSVSLTNPTNEAFADIKEEIEADAAAGKLDALAEEALAEYRAGKATEI